jgi:hypothetical protein
MQGILWMVVGFPAFMYFVGPLIIYFTQRMKANPDLLEIDVHTLPPKAWQYLYENVNLLMAVGFKPIAYLALPSPVTNVRTYLALLVNPETSDKAMITEIFADSGLADSHTLYTEFSTRFASGRFFDTLNSHTLQSFARDPLQTRTQTPSVRDPAELYRLHQWVMSQGIGPETKVPYDFNEPPPAYIKRILVESYDKQVQRGRLAYSSQAGAYRPTLVGAYVMCWALLWPISMIRKMRMSAEEAKVLSKFRGSNGGVRV